MAYAHNFSFAVDFMAARGRSPVLADLRTPSRTPSPTSSPFRGLPGAVKAMPSMSIDKVQQNKGMPACDREEAPSTPRGKFGIPAELPKFDEKTKEPQPRAWDKRSSGKLVFLEEERGLPELPRGWRTPDPSPTRSGLPRCVAYTAVVMEQEDETPSTKEGSTFDEACARMSWADIQDDAGFQTLSRGSVGHPFTCNEPCKYAKKSRGCKEGINCDHCHACEWKKSAAKKRGKAAMPSP
eukprot:TRINITY_DN16172_c0_g2_i1.p1 TRINITY_DN16172_c0_g2~~TRINITY_DN16172_c0_g2_i1.p1  ORF type:complete len:265 (-),score=48.53 TRINITY_DN16172_c0_g2_i1:91-807(-)